MNDGVVEVSIDSAQNHVEEKVFKNSLNQGDGVSVKNHVPNSTDLINNESSVGVPVGSNSSDSNGPEAVPYEKENDSSKNEKGSEKEDGVVDNKLPSTAVMLETSWGSKVYVVGTAHFSKESQEDVAKVIQAVKPNFVVLELCAARSYMLKWGEEEILKMAEKNMELKTMRETIATYGVLQGAMNLLLLSVSAQITRDLGMAPGGEFRRAFREALYIPGCVVQLGDRPIQITLRRAFNSLSWWQCIKFACYIIFSKKKIDQDYIEQCKNQDYLEEMLGILGGEFPEMKKVFVNERDLFLSYRLMTAATMTRTQEGHVVPNTVVGVVGMGHLPGIQRNWEQVDPVELGRIMEVPPPSKVSKVLRFTVKASVLCLALYGVRSLVSKTKIYSSLFR